MLHNIYYSICVICMLYITHDILYLTYCKLYGESADLFQSSSVLAYNCNPPMPSCRLQPHHPAGCRIQPTLYHPKGVPLIRHRPPQAGPTSSPQASPGLEIGAAACAGVPNSVLCLPWWAQCTRNAATDLQGAAQVSQGLQKSSPADFLRGRRQRR